MTFENLHLTEEDRAELGNVNIFPTLFLAGRDGTIVRHFVNFQERETLEPAIRGPAAVRAVGAAGGRRLARGIRVAADRARVLDNKSLISYTLGSLRAVAARSYC